MTQKEDEHTRAQGFRPSTTMSSADATKQYFFCFRKTHKDAFLPEIGLQSGELNLSAGADMKSLFNYEIPPNGSRCEVRTGVALEFVTSDMNKIEALKRLNNAAAEEDELRYTPLSSALSPPKRRTTSSTLHFSQKKVSFKEPLEEDLVILNVKDERGVVMVRSRSGMAWKNKINVLTFYTSLEKDEIVIGVVNYSTEAFVLKAGERFAQLIVHANDAEDSSSSVDRIMTQGPTMSVADYNGLCVMPVFKNTKEVKIPSGESRLVNTDNAMAMKGSDAVYMQLQNFPGVTHNLLCADIHAGVIDGDYRGKVGVIIHNDGNDEIVVPVGQTVAVGMIYKICCPIGKICEVLCPVTVLGRGNEGVEASDVFFTLGDRMGMLEADDISQGEDKMEFHIMKKSEEELKMEEGKRYMVNTGVCIKAEELKKKGLMCHVRATYDDFMEYDSGVRGWKVDRATGEIILLMRGGGNKVYMKDDVLAEVLLLERGTENGQGPGIVDSGDKSMEEGKDAGERGDRGFGSTGV